MKSPPIIFSLASYRFWREPQPIVLCQYSLHHIETRQIQQYNYCPICLNIQILRHPPGLMVFFCWPYSFLFFRPSGFGLRYQPVFMSFTLIACLIARDMFSCSQYRSVKRDYIGIFLCRKLQWNLPLKMLFFSCSTFLRDFSLCQDRLSSDASELGMALLCSSRAGSICGCIQKLCYNPSS